MPFRKITFGGGGTPVAQPDFTVVDPGWVFTTDPTVDPGHGALVSENHAWMQLQPVRETIGVDFVIRVNDQYPFHVDDETPLFASDDIEEP